MRTPPFWSLSKVPLPRPPARICAFITDGASIRWFWFELVGLSRAY
jgi:hypothetical protein